MLHTGDVSHLAKAQEFDDAHQLISEAGLDGRAAIDAMPGIDRLSISALVDEAGELLAAGVPAVLLFGIVSIALFDRMHASL